MTFFPLKQFSWAMFKVKFSNESMSMSVSIWCSAIKWGGWGGSREGGVDEEAEVELLGFRVRVFLNMIVR